MRSRIYRLPQSLEREFNLRAERGQTISFSCRIGSNWNTVTGTAPRDAGWWPSERNVRSLWIPTTIQVEFQILFPLKLFGCFRIKGPQFTKLKISTWIFNFWWEIPCKYGWDTISLCLLTLYKLVILETYILNVIKIRHCIVT